MRTPAKLLSALAFFGGLAVLRADSGTPAPVDVSLSELRGKAAEIQDKIQEDARRVLALKERVRKQQDVIKLTCINDKLVQMKAQMNIADSTNDDLQVALAKNGDDRQALFAQLTQTVGAVHVLREQAAVCVGEPELYKQEAGTSYTSPPIVDDPTNLPEGEFQPPEPPGYASPYR